MTTKTKSKVMAALEAIEKDINDSRTRIEQEVRNSEEKIDAIKAKFKEYRLSQDQLESELIADEQDRIRAAQKQLEELTGEPGIGHNSKGNENG